MSSSNGVQIALSLGSNIQRYHHINNGLLALESVFGRVQCSPVYESEAVGFKGNAFLNLIAIIHSDLSLLDVITILKKIEDDNGRNRGGPKFSPRTLDIDVVTYGDCHGDISGIVLPRPELFKNAFVLLPMVDLTPDQVVPGESQTYREMWLAQGNREQKLAKVPFDRR